MSDQRTDDLIIFFDTTLRDGGQTRGVDFSAADKQFIASVIALSDGMCWKLLHAGVIV